MDAVIASQSPPTSASSLSNRRSKFFLPLSSHGMPKTPMSASSGSSSRRHRFSAVGMPSSPTPSSPPMTPMSPMSPPMSARSFGTFIDSEPSTPAYSPRMGSNWDSSTLVLLSPVSSSSNSSPKEPIWDMMMPLKKSKRASVKAKSSPAVQEIQASTSLSSHPVTPLPVAHQKEAQKENLPPPKEEEEEEATAKADANPKVEEEQTQPAALVTKLAKMKSMLRRKTSGDKKSEKKRREYHDLDRMETVHWTDL